MSAICPRVITLGAGAPIVFLHGWAANADFFAPQRALADQGFRLILPDLPGHGPNAQPDPKLSIADLADSIADLLEAQAVFGALLVGWSMGASVAIDYLQRYGGRDLAGLVILDMTPKVANEASWRFGLSTGETARDMERTAAHLAQAWPKFPAAIARSLFPRGVPPQPERRTWFEAALSANDGPTMAALWNELARLDQREALGEQSSPILAVLGGASALYGSGLADWYRAILGPLSVFVVDGAGHAPQWDAPETVNALLAKRFSALALQS